LGGWAVLSLRTAGGRYLAHQIGSLSAAQTTRGEVGRIESKNLENAGTGSSRGRARRKGKMNKTGGGGRAGGKPQVTKVGGPRELKKGR